MTTPFHSGFIAIVGRPNVGKSTLLNKLVGQKVSITSRKAQTTRHRVTGVRTDPGVQYVFVDTPGFQTRHGGRMNNALNRSVRQTLSDVDVVLVVVEAGKFNAGDKQVVALLPKDRPVLLIINKQDDLKDKGDMLAFVRQVSESRPFAEIIPVSAKHNTGLENLLNTLAKYLPEGQAMYGEDDVTDQTEWVLAAELIREKLFRLSGDEIPYATAVVIDKFEDLGKLRRIYATILVERDSQKAIVIGAGGEKLKAISSQARLDMEKAFGSKVYLEVWVKVKGGWSDDVRVLKSLGIE